MLVLSTLHTLLSQIITPSTGLHTAILSTPAGHLVCYASDRGRPKDEVRVIVGLSGEVWQETLCVDSGDEKSRTGMVSSEVTTTTRNGSADSKGQNQEYMPLMLLTLNSSEEVEWEELELKGKALASHIAKPLSKYREHLQQLSTPTTVVKTPPLNVSVSGTNSAAAR
ncbi:hypothetical protein L218DRAFT_849557 [Marasmius fiardii PR-910]|nr:hypothetical protein L218DRAFT_849557 [Marasmius fiardii PR-910]